VRVCKNIYWVRLVQKVVHLQLYTRSHTTVNILVPKKWTVCWLEDFLGSLQEFCSMCFVSWQKFRGRGWFDPCLNRKIFDHFYQLSLTAYSTSTLHFYRYLTTVAVTKYTSDNFELRDKINTTLCIGNYPSRLLH